MKDKYLYNEVLFFFYLFKSNYFFSVRLRSHFHSVRACIIPEDIKQMLILYYKTERTISLMYII